MSLPPERDELPVVVLVDDDRASLDLLSAYLDGFRDSGAARPRRHRGSRAGPQSAAGGRCA